MRTSPMIKCLIKCLFMLPMLGMLTGCNSMYYKGMEKFGVEKRDILVDRVVDARNAQEKAKVQFSSALEEFQSIVNFKGGELEKRYNKLNREYEQSKGKADNVSARIGKVDSVSKAMFREWRSELKQYQSASLRQSSERKLAGTERNYQQLMSAMRSAESKMEPVLNAFKDQVLYLKHNLNAQAISSLQAELGNIESNVGALIREMEASIAEADQFISGLK